MAIDEDIVNNDAKTRERWEGSKGLYAGVMEEVARRRRDQRVKGWTTMTLVLFLLLLPPEDSAENGLKKKA